jgi:titin
LGLTWDAPASPGSSAITGYTVSWREVGKAWVAGNTKNVTVRSATITGLIAGKSYQVRVNAANATSTGAWSALTTGIVPVKAPAPQNLKGVANGKQITLTWSAVKTPSHSPVVKYSAYCAVGKENPARANAGRTATTATVTVTQNKRYVCRVAAVTAAGRGTDSAPVRVTIR